MDTRSTTAAAAAAAAVAGDASLVVRIKKEPTSSSDEMKEFAETAMNELLGWYGYDGGGEDEDGADESDVRVRTRSIGDSSGPECSDSGGGGGGGGGGSGSGPGGPWCGWCSRPMTDGAQATGAFCSELCFSQSRRASFKRNRTCDWCRHVRHTVAHVDVRDGARHLQFCGDKCLNQYKMHIFCRETRAHLELHPHPHPAGHPSASGVINDTAALITPDLWLRDCKDEGCSPDRQAASMSPRQPQSASHESSTGVPPRKRHCTAASRRSLGYSASRRTRTSTVTSYHEPTPEVPQDLRVRPRSPTEAAAANESTVPKTPSVEQPRHWPPAPPPVTVLVPYPVIVPVPVPLPLPIPIPVSEELLKRVTANASSATTTTSTTSSTTTATSKTTTTKVEISEQQTDVQSAPVELTTTPSVRTLRKRKRPAGKEGSGRDQQNTRRTVPA